MSWITIPKWDNEGVAPSDNLSTNGFQGGYKPPASVFNFFFNKYGKLFKELQDVTEKKAGKSVAGQKVRPTIDTIGTVTVGDNAEIFNDYRDRTYASDGSKFAAEGNVASGNFSHAEGLSTTASGENSHAEGAKTIASGENSHAEGSGTTASGISSHAEGWVTVASGYASHAEGWSSKASGDFSHAEGSGTTASGECSHATGSHTIANGRQFVSGKWNKNMNGCKTDSDQSADNSIFIVGYGTEDTQANAFRISAAGKCYGTQSFGSSGADYAEYFEWRDGNKNNEDRRGLFVTLDGDKIRLANGNDDYIVGVISANPSIIGDVQSENWHGMYKKDIFGQSLTETIEIPESTNEKTGEVIPAHTVTKYVVNPDYNPDEEYISREFRKEWACVGLMGKLIVVDDGTCEVNGYCKATNGGKATKAETGYRVMKRLDDTHIQILYR